MTEEDSNKITPSPLQLFTSSSFHFDYEFDEGSSSIIGRQVMNVVLSVMSKLKQVPFLITHEIKNELEKLQNVLLEKVTDEEGAELDVCVRTLLLIVDDENNHDEHEKYIDQMFKCVDNSNKFILYAYLFRFVAIKIPSHFERFMTTCINYYQIALALNPSKTNYNENFKIIETIEEHLKDCSQLQQVLTTIRPIQNVSIVHPLCTKQILQLFYYEFKQSGDLNESDEECFLAAEEESLLEKLKNFKLIDLTEILISIVRLYQIDTSLRTFILFQVMRRVANRRFNLDPTLKFQIHSHILRSMNEMIERNNLQVVHLPFGHVFQHEQNVLVVSDYIHVLNCVYCSLTSSFSGMENIVWTSIAKSSIPTLLKIENLIPNVEKSSYYAYLSRLSYYTGDLIMEEDYLQKAERYMEEHDKVYPYATD